MKKIIKSIKKFLKKIKRYILYKLSPDSLTKKERKKAEKEFGNGYTLWTRFCRFITGVNNFAVA